MGALKSMTITKSPPAKPLTYPRKTVERAERSLRCSPFQMPLFTAMRSNSVKLQEILGAAGVQQQYTKQPLSELTAENALLWLIQVGILRREVDGQGITDHFRLTPLGHQITNDLSLKATVLPLPTWGDRILNALSRWFRLPI